MLGDTAVAVNPADERYRELVGRTAVLPLLGRELPIVADERVDPELRHRRAQDHAGPRPDRLRHRPRPRAADHPGHRPRRPHHRRGRALRGPRHRRGPRARGRRPAGGRRAREGRGLHPQRGHLRPLRHPHRAAHLAAVVHAHGRAQGAGHRGRARRPRALRARALGPGLRRLDGEPAALVHLAPALVGPSAPGLVLRGRGLLTRPSSPKQEPQALPRAAAARRLRRETDVLDTWFSSALWPFATWGWPDERRPRVLLPDEPAQHGPRDHLPVGRAHGHDGPRVRGRRALPRGLHPLGDPGRRRAPHEQVAGQRHRPPRDDRQVRRRRHALRPAAHVEQPGRALLRREDRHGPQLRQQALERRPARAAGGRRRRGRRAPTTTSSTAGSRAAWRAPRRPCARPSPPATSRWRSTSSTTSSGTSSATGTSSSSRRASTATTQPRGPRPPATPCSCSTASCAWRTRSCPS